MAHEKAAISTKYTFEENRIIIESNDQEWLDYIKTEILTRKKDVDGNMQAAVKFVGYCWRRSRMRNVLEVLARNKKVTYEEVFQTFKGAFGKRRGLSGVMSGFTRNAVRAGLKKNWVKYEDAEDGGTYSIDEKIYPTIKAEVNRLKDAR